MTYFAGMKKDNSEYSVIKMKSVQLLKIVNGSENLKDLQIEANLFF